MPPDETSTPAPALPAEPPAVTAPPSETRIERLQREVREQNEVLHRAKKTAVMNANGKLRWPAKPPEPKPPTEAEKRAASREAVREVVRTFLEETVRIKRGSLAKTRLQHILEATFHTACDTRSPGQIHAVKALLERGFGPPPTAEEELGAAGRKGGLTVVYIDRNALPADIPIVDEHEIQRQLKAPEFVEAEVVEEGQANGR